MKKFHEVINEKAKEAPKPGKKHQVKYKFLANGKRMEYGEYEKFMRELKTAIKGKE